MGPQSRFESSCQVRCRLTVRFRMKKARLRITTVCDGQRVTVVFDFPDLSMASRALGMATPLFRANGGKVPDRVTTEQLRLIPRLDASDAPSRSDGRRGV